MVLEFTLHQTSRPHRATLHSFLFKGRATKLFFRTGWIQPILPNIPSLYGPFLGRPKFVHTEFVSRRSSYLLRHTSLALLLGTFLASLARLYNSNLQPPLRCDDTPPLRHIPLAAHLRQPFGDIPSYAKHWHPFDSYSKGYAKDINDARSALLSLCPFVSRDRNSCRPRNSPKPLFRSSPQGGKSARQNQGGKQRRMPI
jgi:hypothetical protein